MGRRKLKPQNTKAYPRAFSGWVWFGLGSVLLLSVIAAFAFWRGGKTSPSFTPEATGGAKLKADRQQVDLGNVQLGQTVAVSFELTNTGDQPLRFTDQPYIEVVEGC
jgi:hypothetical protein